MGTLLGQLVAWGLVYETASSGEAQVGRPSPVVHPSPPTAAMAIYLKIPAFKIGLLGLGGSRRKETRFPNPSYQIAGIGMAVPGLGKLHRRGWPGTLPTSADTVVALRFGRPHVLPHFSCGPHHDEGPCRNLPGHGDRLIEDPWDSRQPLRRGGA